MRPNRSSWMIALCAALSACTANTSATGDGTGAGGTGAGGHVSAGGSSTGGASGGTAGTAQTGGSAGAGAGGAVGGKGGTSSGGSAGQAQGGSGATGGNVSSGVACESGPTNPAGLVTGVWTDITPPDPFNPGEEANNFVNDVQFDPSHPATVYVLNKGVEKSTDGGKTWQNISTFWLPQRIRIDPDNSDHLLTFQGVHATGFFETTNGGQTWDTPAGFTAILDQIGGDTDFYMLDVDPTDFGHYLLTFHWYWDECADGCKSGVVECFDDGANCVAHPPIPGVTGNGGHNAFFLYNPALGLGDAKTWIFMTQPGGAGEGYWRTTDAGTTWNLASLVPMIHGGSQLYYTTEGMLYAAAWNSLQKSSDNGQSWTQAYANGAFAVQGNGTNLFTTSSPGGKFQTAPEASGTPWSDFGDHTFAHGASAITYDPCNHILYGAMREDGAWAMKLE